VAQASLAQHTTPAAYQQCATVFQRAHLNVHELKLCLVHIMDLCVTPSVRQEKTGSAACDILGLLWAI